MYIKCESREAAGAVYKALHGWWFDGEYWDNRAWDGNGNPSFHCGGVELLLWVWTSDSGSNVFRRRYWVHFDLVFGLEIFCSILKELVSILIFTLTRFNLHFVHHPKYELIVITIFQASW